MKKLICVVISCVMILSCFAGCGKEQSTTPTGFEKNFKVAVVQQVEHASLDEISAAVMAELKAQAEAKGVGMVVEKFNGQGDQTALNQIGAQAVSDGYDAIIPVATLAAQCMVTAAEGRENEEVPSVSSDALPALTGSRCVGTGQSGRFIPANKVAPQNFLSLFPIGGARTFLYSGGKNMKKLPGKRWYP